MDGRDSKHGGKRRDTRVERQEKKDGLKNGEGTRRGRDKDRGIERVSHREAGEKGKPKQTHGKMGNMNMEKKPFQMFTVIFDPSFPLPPLSPSDPHHVFH